MKIISYILSALICFTLTARAEYSTDKADAEYLSVKHEYVLNADGSVDYHYSHKLKALSGFAVNRAYGETFIVYNPKFQSLKVTKAQTTMADGKIVSSPANAYNEVLPGFANKASSYLHLREMVVTHTGLERGCVVGLEYTIHSNPGFFPGLYGKITAGDRSPIKKFEIVIKIPPGIKLDYILKNGAAKPVQANESGYESYAWTFNDIPLAAVENSQPPLDEFMPTLYFSTVFPDDFINFILKAPDELTKLDDKAKQAVEDIIKDKLTDFDKVAALRDYISDNVGQMNCDLAYLGFRPLPAQETFNGNSGSQLDRAVLFSAFCKYAGISPLMVFMTVNEAEIDEAGIIDLSAPVLFYYNGYVFDPNSHNGLKPSIYMSLAASSMEDFFKAPANLHAIPKDVDYQAGDFDLKKYLTLNAKALEVDPRLITQAGKLSLTCSMTIGDSSLATGSAIITEGTDNIIKNKSDFDDAIKRAFLTANLDAAVSENNYLTNECLTFSRNISFKSKAAPEDIAGITKIDLPFAPGSIFEMHLSLGPGQRSTPVKLNKLVDEDYTYNIKIPENMELAVTPKNFSLQNSAGEVEISFTITGNGIKAVRKLRLNSDMLPAEKYGELLELLKAWEDKYAKAVYLQKKK